MEEKKDAGKAEAKKALYFVFDVESVGLHGEAFSVGWVVVNERGTELDFGYLACPTEAAFGTNADRAWVMENCPMLPPTHDVPNDMRLDFWGVWKHWKGLGAIMAADCLWPVEARFLAECVDDHPEARNWEGPYPLIDVASVRLAVGLDPLGTNERLPNELPQHAPLPDARQSARLLLEALRLPTPTPEAPHE